LRLYAEYLELSLDDLIARQRLGVDEAPASLNSAEPAPGQSQESEKVLSNSPTAEAVSEPRTNKSLPTPEKTKGFISRIQQILPHRKGRSVPVESAEQIKPSEPEST
jgi:hypothetical protein